VVCNYHATCWHCGENDAEFCNLVVIAPETANVLEISDMTGVSMPQTRVIYALVKKLNDRPTGGS